VAGGVAVADGKLVKVGGGIAFELAATAVAAGKAFAVAKADGTRDSIAWALAATVAPHGWSVASSSTARVDTAAATSSRVQPANADALQARPSKAIISLLAIGKERALRLIGIGLPFAGFWGCDFRRRKNDQTRDGMCFIRPASQYLRMTNVSESGPDPNGPR
jgi:hypothetical protein